MESVPVPEPPVIAIEILSLSEGMIAVGRKVAEYLSAGSEEVWLIDHRTADAERLLRDGRTLESGRLPGFRISIDELVSV